MIVLEVKVQHTHGTLSLWSWHNSMQVNTSQLGLMSRLLKKHWCTLTLLTLNKSTVSKLNFMLYSALEWP